MKKEIRIWDLDGTIIDSSHRQLTREDGILDLEHWIENTTPDKIRKDSLLPLCRDYKEGITNTNVITVIATARSMTITDMAYIHDFLGKPDYFVYRKSDDSRPDHVIKVEGLTRLVSRFPKESVIKFWDDNLTNLQEVNNKLKTMGYPVITYHVTGE